MNRRTYKSTTRIFPNRQPVFREYWYFPLDTYMNYYFLWRCCPTRAMASSVLRFLGHTQRHTTVGSTPLDEWSARRSDLYMTTHNTHNRRTYMSSVGFEPTISAGDRPQAYALDRTATTRAATTHTGIKSQNRSRLLHLHPFKFFIYWYSYHLVMLCL
jgi:hypothetical protein